MKVLKRGKKAPKILKIQCEGCKSSLAIEEHDWKKGTYGSERFVKCPVCRKEVIKPGTEYCGDF